MKDTTDNKADDGFDELLEDLTEPEHNAKLTMINKPRIKQTITAPVEAYKYAGIELYPSVFKEIMLKLYPDKQFTRQDAIEGVVNYHISHGGLCKKPNYVSAFKKGIAELQADGYQLDNLAYGCWKLKSKDASTEIKLADIISKSKGKTSNADLKELFDNLSKLPAEKIAAINEFVKRMM